MPRRAIFVAHHRNIELRPNLMPVFVKVALFDLITLPFTGNNFLH